MNDEFSAQKVSTPFSDSCGDCIQLLTYVEVERSFGKKTY